MGITWRDSPAELVALLRRQGLAPERVDNVEAAWKVFREFLTRRVDGLKAGPDSDADGFIVQWGRYTWHDHLPSLSFTRQFAVYTSDTGAEDDCYQPEHWQVSLDLVFPDAPAFADLDRLNAQDTGFDFSPASPERGRAIGEVQWRLRHHPALQALWASVPVRSVVTWDRAG